MEYAFAYISAIEHTCSFILILARVFLHLALLKYSANILESILALMSGQSHAAGSAGSRC